MPRLIWVFVGRTCHFVGFVMRQLSYLAMSWLFCLFSSPEPKAHWWAYRIGRPLSCIVCPSAIHTFSTSSPQKKLGQPKSNFIWSLSGMGERKFVQMVHVIWPKWPPCPYKNLKKSSSLEPKGRWLWNLVCSIGCSSTTKFVQMMTLGWPWPILWQGQVWSLMLLYGKKVKQWIFRNYCHLCFETSNRWPNWQDVSVDIKTLSPGGCIPLPGAIYMY